MPFPARSAAIRCGVYLALLVTTGCLRTQNVTAVGASVQPPQPQPSSVPPTDPFLHFSSYLRMTPFNSSPPAVLSGFAYFAGGDPTTGIELWRTDGTAAGTTLVKDLNPGPESSSPDGFITVGTLIFFNATYPGLHGRGLWRTDGTAVGTFPVYFSNGDVRITAAGSVAVFETLTTPATLFASDGTVAGTTSLGQNPTSKSCYASGPLCYFTVTVSGTGPTLWKTDGTLVNTVQVAALGAGFAGFSLGVFNGGMLFQTIVAATSTLTRIDLTAGTSLVLTTTIATNQAMSIFVGSLAVYLRAGADLWATDGTVVNTLKLVSLPQAGASNFADLSGKALFTAYDATLGFGLWTSDGTVAGTAILKAFPLGAQEITVIGTTAYFQADDPVAGRELWKTDGTLAGTVMVGDLVPGGGSSEPGNFFGIGAQAYFFGTAVGGVQWLWKTDGTAAGTTLVQSVRVPSGAGSGSTVGTLPIGNGLLVTSVHEVDLVTLAGAPVRLATFANAIASAPFPFGNRAIFTVSSLTAPTAQLWISDGTVAGTQMVLSLGTFLSTSLPNPPQMTAAQTLGGTEFFFVTTTIPPTVQAWKTDGTAAGTLLLKDFGTTVAAAGVSELVYGGKFYFNVFGLAGNLWTSDGTVVGTVQPLPAYELESQMILFQNKMLFLAQDPVPSAAQLYLSDGTIGGTTALFTGSLATEVNTPLMGGKDIFYFTSTLDGFIWSSNGTIAGTVDLGVAPGGSGTVFSDLLVDSAGSASANLFASDGTVAGTRSVPAALVAGTQSQPTDVNASGPQLFGGTYFYDAQVAYNEPNPSTLETELIAGATNGLWRADLGLTSTSLVRTPSQMAGYLRTPLTQLGSTLVGIGGDDFNPYGEVVYLISF